MDDLDLAQYMKEQQALAQKQKDALAEELAQRRAAQAPNIGVSPLAAMVEGIYGGQELQRAAGALEERQAQKDAELAALEAQLLKAGGGIGGMSPAALARMEREKGTQERKDISEVSKWEGKLSDQASKIEKPLLDTFEQFNTIENALNSKKLDRIKNVLGVFARGVAAERGVLTDQDIARVFNKTLGDTANEWKQYLTGSRSNVSDLAMRSMREAMNAAKREAHRKAKAQIDRYKVSNKSLQTVKRYGLESTVDSLADSLSGSEVFKYFKGGDKQGSGDTSAAQRLREKYRLKK